MAQKRYYWLKLQDGFFGSKRIKKLRKLAGGDTFTIIYLKMQLLAIHSEGILRWTGLEDDFASELALDLDEEPENVAVTLQYLLSCGLAETDDNVSFFLPYAVENTGSETSSAERMRTKRAQLRTQEEQCAKLCEHSDGEKEIEKEKDKEIEKESKKRKRFTPPTLEEVQAYVSERGSAVDANEFFEYYQTGHWIDSEGKPVQNWKQKLLTWEKHERQKKKPYAAECKKDPDVDMDKLTAFLNSM